MRIVVTGATSFIGLAVIEELLHGGHEVLAVVRPDSPGGKSWKEGRESISWSAGWIVSGIWRIPRSWRIPRPCRTPRPWRTPRPCQTPWPWRAGQMWWTGKTWRTGQMWRAG